MMVWKMIFLFQGCIFRFHVNLRGCSVWKIQAAKTQLLGLGLTAPRILERLKVYDAQVGASFKRWLPKSRLEAVDIHPVKLTWNLKMNPGKRRFLLKTIIFRFHVSFRGGRYCQFNPTVCRLLYYLGGGQISSINITFCFPQIRGWKKCLCHSVTVELIPVIIRRCPYLWSPYGPPWSPVAALVIPHCFQPTSL